MNEKRNIFAHHHPVSKAERIAQSGHKPAIVWFTGLSGSGKSTVAGAVEEMLHAQNIHTYLLDGDNLRMGLNSDLGFSEADRDENIRRVGQVAKLFVDAGVVVLSSFISPSAAERARVRELVSVDEFIEVFVNCPLEVCEERDVKGLYAKARAGLIESFTGVSAPYEAPSNAEIEIDTHSLSIAESAGMVANYVLKKIKN